MKQFINLTIGIAILLILFSFTSDALAQTLSNSQYKLQLGNFNVSSANLTGNGTKLNYALGQSSYGIYKGTNYTVIAGFPSSTGAIVFSFSISPTLIDFGTISPTNPITRTNTLTVSNGSANGFSVTVTQDHPLKSANGALIPDTSCDNGSCSASKADIWTNTLTYGFGYRCDPSATGQANDCNSSFLAGNVYKPFSSSSQTIMTGTTGRNRQSKITYKLNVSGSQEPGTYGNILTYIATPNF